MAMDRWGDRQRERDVLWRISSCDRGDGQISRPATGRLDPGRTESSISVHMSAGSRPRKRQRFSLSQDGRTLVSQFKACLARGVFSYSGYFFDSAFNRLNEVHTHIRESNLLYSLHLPIQMLTSSRNTLPDTPRVMFIPILKHLVAWSGWPFAINLQN